MATRHVYRMQFWTEEEDRPRLDFTLPENGRNIDWLEIGNIMLGDLPA